MAQIEAKNLCREHKIILENRTHLSITGVERVDVAIPTQFLCVVCGQKLQICGKNLSVGQLNVDSGAVVITGEISSIQYLGEKKSIFQRMFG